MEIAYRDEKAWQLHHQPVARRTIELDGIGPVSVVDRDRKGFIVQRRRADLYEIPEPYYTEMMRRVAEECYWGLDVPVEVLP